MGENPDQDVLSMNTEKLIEEVLRLRNAIRTHRDQEGHDRCWLDDGDLYCILPEGLRGSQELPSLSEWKKKCAEYCEQYWSLRQP